MEALINPLPVRDSINVFLIGNNPIELSNIYEKLKGIRNKSYNAEIGFDLKGLYKKIMKFNPTCILIDDNLDKPYLTKLLAKLARGSKTKDIPVTILKNSNYHQNCIAGVQDFLLKDSITPESLSNSIMNTIRLRKMHQYLYKSFKRNTGRLSYFLNN